MIGIPRSARDCREKGRQDIERDLWYKISVANEIKSFFLKGPAGKLEALLNKGQPETKYAALVCHPHPLYGGTMHNKVVYHAMKALNGFGFPVLRFNFRGAGLSEGEHDKGQ